MFNRLLKVFKNSSKLTDSSIFNNVKVARFARNVICDFLSDFQTLCRLNVTKVSRILVRTQNLKFAVQTQVGAAHQNYA